MPFDAEPSVETTTRDRMIRLRDFLAALPAHKYDMTSWGYQFADYEAHTCGTAACIGGWANVLFADRLLPHGETGRLLGLDEENSLVVFNPDDWLDADRHPVSRAVAVIDHYLETGKIDWSVA